MPVVFGKKREDGKIRVGATVSRIMDKDLGKTREITADDYPEGYFVERLPKHPEPKRGIDNVMLYDPKTEEFSFEEKERPLNPDEVQAQISEDLSALLRKLDEVLEELRG